MKDDTVEKRLCLILRTCTVLLEMWQVDVIRVIFVVMSCTPYRNATQRSGPNIETVVQTSSCFLYWNGRKYFFAMHLLIDRQDQDNGFDHGILQTNKQQQITKKRKRTSKTANKILEVFWVVTLADVISPSENQWKLQLVTRAFFYDFYNKDFSIKPWVRWSWLIFSYLSILYRSTFSLMEKVTLLCSLLHRWIWKNLGIFLELQN